MNFLRCKCYQHVKKLLTKGKRINKGSVKCNEKNISFNENIGRAVQVPKKIILLKSLARHLWKTQSWSPEIRRRNLASVSTFSESKFPLKWGFPLVSFLVFLLSLSPSFPCTPHPKQSRFSLLIARMQKRSLRIFFFSQPHLMENHQTLSVWVRCK